MRREGNKEEAEVTAEKEAIKRGREWKQDSSESLPLLTFIAVCVVFAGCSEGLCFHFIFLFFADGAIRPGTSKLRHRLQQSTFACAMNDSCFLSRVNTMQSWIYQVK